MQYPLSRFGNQNPQARHRFQQLPDDDHEVRYSYIWDTIENQVVVVSDIELDRGSGIFVAQFLVLLFIRFEMLFGVHLQLCRINVSF